MLEELVAVAVDVLDPHRGDHLAQLAEDDVLGLLAISSPFRPSRRMAAFCITSGLVPMATVNTLGTLTRMFSIDSAPRSGISIWIGSRLR